ncbi:MAG: hypothetical protein KDA61_13785, partial [Planctomycetales bacterium]|nr:hypothetical protein [Planctomycetales bacterium]
MAHSSLRAVHARPASHSVRKHRPLRCEALESRRLLAAESFGSTSLVNELTVRLQSTSVGGGSVATSDSSTVVAFTGKGPTDDLGVYARRFDADFSPLGSAFRVNATRPEAQYDPVVAMHVDGSFVIAWAGRGSGDQQGVFFQRYDANGAPLGGETLVNVTRGGVQDQPAVAVDSDGTFAIAWHGVGLEDVDGVFWRRFAANGVATTPEIRVNSHFADEQVRPSLAIANDGTTLV